MRDTSNTTATAADEPAFININVDMDSNNNNNITNNVITENNGPALEMNNKHGTDGDVIKSNVTDMIKVELVEDQEKFWCPEKKMMSLELLLNGGDEAEYFSTSEGTDKDSKYGMSPRSDGGLSPDSACLIPIDYGTPPATPYSQAVLNPHRPIAICSICGSESGRCHASDPESMQPFFASSLAFEGTLSSADWLCMKCYSKWYNRCKRKAAAAAASINGANELALALIPSPGTVTPPPPKASRKRVRGEGKEKGPRKPREKGPPRPLHSEVNQPSEQIILDGDSDSDDASIILAAMPMNYSHNLMNNTIHNSLNGFHVRSSAAESSGSSGYTTPPAVHTPPPPPPPVQQQQQHHHHQHHQHQHIAARDLEMEVDELHSELHRARAELMRLAQEISRRDEQMEGMLHFVKTEMAAMHGLLKDIATVRWKAPAVHPHPPVNTHVFHMNGKVLDNATHIAANGCLIPRPLTDALMHVHAQSN